MLEYVVESFINMIHYFQNIVPFQLGDGYAGMFTGSLFILWVGYSMLDLLLTYFNGDGSDTDKNKKD